MLISHKKQFIFTKTVKTAGTSIEAYFEKYCMPDGEWQWSHRRDEYVSDSGIIGARKSNPSTARWYNHMSAARIQALVGATVWDSYYKFTVVRNPFDKLVSGYYMFARPSQKDSYSKKFDSIVKRLFGVKVVPQTHPEREIELFRRWVHEFCALVKQNKTTIEKADVPHFMLPKALSLVDRDKYLIASRESVDFYIRFEKLVDDIRHVCENLSLEFDLSDVKEIKKGRRNNQIKLCDYYDCATEKIVKDIYRWEIERFGYALG